MLARLSGLVEVQELDGIDFIRECAAVIDEENLRWHGVMENWLCQLV